MIYVEHKQQYSTRMYLLVIIDSLTYWIVVTKALRTVYSMPRSKSMVP